MLKKTTGFSGTYTGNVTFTGDLTVSGTGTFTTGLVATTGFVVTDGIILSGVTATGGADTALYLRAPASYGAADTIAAFQVNTSTVASVFGDGAATFASTLTLTTGAITSGVTATGGADVAFNLTAPASYGSADKILNLNVNGSNKAWVTGTGGCTFSSTGVFTGSIRVTDGMLGASGSPSTMTSDVADGGTAVGSIIEAGSPFSTAGSKILSIRNSGEKAYVSYTGEIGAPGLIATNKSINTTAGDSATINAMAGRFRKDTSGTDFTLTNSFITANSIVLLTYASAPGITGYELVCVASSGSAVITFTSAGVAAAPTANTDVNFLVVN